jgi:cyclopropane fatty-acyl-phospholipid synthase-like methyltransferase
MRTWHQVWQNKGLSRTPDDLVSGDVLDGLMDLDGYHSPTSSLSVEDHEVQFRQAVDVLDIGPRDTVFEVGCGAGAFLYWLRPRCASVGGLDYAESLIAHARRVLPAADLQYGEARSLAMIPQYDVVLSNGVFIYFPDEQYAYDVLRRMIQKSRRAIGILDVNDAEHRREFEQMRAMSHGDQRSRYDGLEQLYLRREFFKEVAAELGLSCRIDKPRMPNSVNARFRYHVWLRKD